MLSCLIKKCVVNVTWQFEKGAYIPAITVCFQQQQGLKPNTCVVIPTPTPNIGPSLDFSDSQNSQYLSCV